jgi:hypothetical protein
VFGVPVVIEKQYERVFGLCHSWEHLVGAHSHRRQIIARRRATTDFIDQFPQRFGAIIVIGRKEERTAALSYPALEMAQQGRFA